VYTYHQRTGEVVEQIRKGLKGEGMGDLAVKIVDTSSTSTDLLVRERREPFRKRTYYLPQVLVYEGDEKARELDWETDILGAIDWSSFTISPPSGGLPKGDVELLGGVRSIDMSILAGGTATAVSEGTSAAKFDPVFAVRSLMDHVPNPWIAQEWVDRYIADLKKAGWTEQELAERQQYVIREMLSAAGTVIEEASRHVFDEGLEAGRIAFHLIAEKWWPNWEVPRHSLIEVVEGAKRQRRDDDNDFERNLFDPLYPAELNGLELKAACFLDRQSAVTWWYRNLVRSNAYGLQGWRRHRIYPDLIFAQEKDGDVERWVVIETKGDHLSGNIDSEYKKDVFEKLTEAYPKRVGEIGQLTLFEKQAEYRCVMVMEASWERELKERFTPNP
jgi:type III restriction enzyme